MKIGEKEQEDKEGNIVYYHYVQTNTQGINQSVLIKFLFENSTKKEY